ncbi:MAG: sigma-70 family RNA polymerase sigma factor [Flavobacteriales bacterium]|jgi:RNA polymerase sigma factor (sigma-70 family)|nr:sigma-70 family RNA polymerase sigma factor [Flavobacteriales bacterium]MDP4717206.1 sigma-70 family RNA polymerase sigma factor [Flavobacteriales bacterium]MDP4731593.1 sigma-70 family RNA polymerase sigma factor [Flavobacteriales bacterium]MDP4818260.1 sigma-70 family RNA polymerase sigma factor [Flavobacteriales bacterium]MDP4951338.1 sigma-70 family RNA polymerase sigma factor [Flavobacteriales bacterium]
MELIDHLSDKAKKDYLLVLRALNEKDQRAYTELMGRYKDSVYFMLLKMVNNSDDAEDLTIETFSKAFKRLDQYTPQFAFSTWLFKIASNHSIDFIRKKRIKAISIDQGFSNEDGESYVIPVKEDSLDPEESMQKDERVQRMRDVVEKLKPRYKRLVELRYFEEKSYEEISEILEIPLGTVKAQLFRARDFMFDLMKTTKGNF